MTATAACGLMPCPSGTNFKKKARPAFLDNLSILSEEGTNEAVFPLIFAIIACDISYSRLVYS